MGTSLDQLSSRLEALKEEMRLRAEGHEREHTLQSEALRIAREELGKRLINMNHLQEQVYRERAEFLSRGVYDAAHQHLSMRLQNIEAQVANYAGRFWMMAVIPSIILMVMQVLLYILKGR